MVSRSKEHLGVFGRIANCLGMVAWQKIGEPTEYHPAIHWRPYIRRLHPLTWLASIVATLAVFATHGGSGVGEFWKDFIEDSVWWFAPKDEV